MKQELKPIERTQQPTATNNDVRFYGNVRFGVNGFSIVIFATEDCNRYRGSFLASLHSHLYSLRLG